MSEIRSFIKGSPALCLSLLCLGLTITACDSGSPAGDDATASRSSAALRGQALPEGYRLDPFVPHSRHQSHAGPYSGSQENPHSGKSALSDLPPANPAAAVSPALSRSPEYSRSENAAALHEKQHDKKAWTIMVYMSGDNNLEAIAHMDMLEMEKALPEDAEIIVLMDRSPEFFDGFGNEKGARIYRIRRSAAGYDMEKFYDSFNMSLLPPRLNSEVIKDLGSINMSDPRNLETFIRFAAENYPAERYALIGWDHGNGWYGLLGDDENGDYMTVHEYTEAAARAAQALPKKKFDLVMYDMCLMGQLDVLYETRKITDFMVASAPSIPSYASDYIAILPLFTREMPVEDLGKEIVKRNIAFFNRHNAVSDLASFSFYDLRHLDDVTESLEDLVSALRRELPANAVSLMRNTIDALHYESSGFDEAEQGLKSPSAVDIFDWLDILEKSHSSLREEITELREALSRLIIHTENTRGYDYAHGLSVYLPLTAKNMATRDNVIPAVWGPRRERNYPATEFAIKSGLKDYLADLYARQQDMKIAAPKISPPEIGRIKSSSGKKELVPENVITPLSQYSMGFDVTGEQILWLRFLQLVSDPAQPDRKYVSFAQNILDLKNHTPESINDPRKYLPKFRDGTTSFIREIPGQAYELNDGVNSVKVTVDHTSLNQDEIRISGLYQDQCTGGEIPVTAVFDSNRKTAAQILDSKGSQLLPCSQNAVFKPYLSYLDADGKMQLEVSGSVKPGMTKLILANLPDNARVSYVLTSANISGARGRAQTSGEHVIRNNPEQLRLMNNAKAGLQEIFDSYAVGYFASNMESDLDLLPTRGILSFRPDGFKAKGLSLPSWNTAAGDQGIMFVTGNLNAPLAPALLETYDANGRTDNVFRNASSFQLFMDRDDSGRKIFYLIAQGTGDRFALFPLRDINEDSLRGSWIAENQFWSFDSGRVTFKYSGTRVPANVGVHKGTYALKNNELTVSGLPEDKYYIIVDRLHEKLYIMSAGKVHSILDRATADGSMTLREFRELVPGRWQYRNNAGKLTALEITPAGRPGLLRFRFTEDGRTSEAVGSPESAVILLSFDNGARMKAGFKYEKGASGDSLTLSFDNGGSYVFTRN